MRSLKKRIYHVLVANDSHDGLGRFIEISLIGLIALNILFLILDTVQSIRAEYDPFFYSFELFSVAIFTLEYVLRVWTITEDHRYSHPLTGRIKYMLTPMAILDLLAFLPIYFTVLHLDMRYLWIIRVTRIARIFKIARYMKALSTIGDVINHKKEQLLVSFSFIFLMLVVASCIMYTLEYPVQPEKFSSIPETMWWAAAAMTTVGYGDVFPITPLGKLIASLVSVLGVALFALPTGILASGFSEELRKKETRPTCPHCNKEL